MQIPIIKEIKRLHYNWPNHFTHQGIPIYTLPLTNRPIIKLELILESGAFMEDKIGVAHFISKMLLEGTAKKNNEKIADYIDYYGASLSITANKDYFTIELLVLAKHFSNMWNLVEELLFESIFPQQALQIQKSIHKQKIKAMQAKNAYVAYQKCKESIFGKNHLYGRIITQKDIDNIKKTDLQNYYKNRFYYKPSLFIVGKTDDKFMQPVMRFLTGLHTYMYNTTLPTFVQEKITLHTHTQHLYIPRKNNLQAAICIGLPLSIHKNDSEYPILYIVNTLLGGYFGGKLIQTIREKKGYTYHISSHLDSYKHQTYFYIVSNVIKKYVKDTIEAIYKEINAIQQGNIGVEELKNLQNYMLVELLKSMSHPFQVMKNFQDIYFYQLDTFYYTKFFQLIRNITVKELSQIAQKYLVKQNFIEVIVG